MDFLILGLGSKEPNLVILVVVEVLQLAELRSRRPPEVHRDRPGLGNLERVQQLGGPRRSEKFRFRVLGLRLGRRWRRPREFRRHELVVVVVVCHR